MDLFESLGKEQIQKDAPLAAFMRPQELNEFVGQEHLVGVGMPLRLLMENHQAISMIFWGPPGVGKTTLARIFANACDAQIHELSAVASGVADVRKVIEKAGANRKLGQRTILFIDEIHCFNKPQQDALLHSVEDGMLFLIGATTENPSFEVISPLLSRCRVYVLKPLEAKDLEILLNRAVKAYMAKRQEKIVLDEKAKNLLIQFAAGDGRELINGLELAAYLAKPDTSQAKQITPEIISLAFQRKTARYDKAGDAHYDTISAFIKSVRGSDPNAAIHYLARMLEAGEDPLFIARRLIILASEDIGNADPQALVLATSAFQAVHSVGMPEARLVLAQATTYLASAPKSNASYKAISAATKDLQENTPGPIPLHIRNAPTKLMAEQGYGKDYRYPHDEPEGFVDEDYLPENLQGKIYYIPVERGIESKFRERLQKFWKGYRDLFDKQTKNDKNDF
ncbi:MAG: replication-associated recombination protein A [bacterium]